MTVTLTSESDQSANGPLAAADRIESLDVLRGVALLGILLMNILGFGLHSAGYFNPLIGTTEGAPGHALNMGLWALLDITVEGSMRGLFSMLFGASLLLFTTGPSAKPGRLHYRRQFWLLCFGLFNGYLLLWSGDILFTYALAGMLLYPLRNVRSRSLIIGALVLGLLTSASGVLSTVGLSWLRAEAQPALTAPLDANVSAEARNAAEEWLDFTATMAPTDDDLASELSARRAGYSENFVWNAEVMAETLLFVVPVIMLWDALLMMLIGMLLMRWGVLSGQRSTAFYWRLLCGGALLGLTINTLEVYSLVASAFDPLLAMSYFAPTYDLGRLGMSLAWLALVMLLCQWARPARWWRWLQPRLAAVGRTALSNYLMHSAFALLLFSGAGFGLVGALDRWQLYLVVLAIWVIQLLLAPLWLDHFRFGPLEWLWRWLTYGRRPALRR